MQLTNEKSDDYAVDRLKSSAIATLESADPDVRITSTDYFNNAFVPDLILRWPKTGTERQVFLRTTGNPRYLLEDVNLIRGRDPIVMPLADVAEGEEAIDLQDVSRTSGTLVAGERGFQALASERNDATVIGLAAKAFLQGGSGLVSTGEARSYGRSVAAGFDAALRGETQSTADALNSASAVLDYERSNQVGEFLRAVWVGSGAPLSTFPSAVDVSANLDPAALEILIESVDVVDDGFWERIGRLQTLKTLSQVEIGKESENYQRLVRASLRHLRARSARVARELARGEDPRWFPFDGTLGLAFGGTAVLFSDAKLSEYTVVGDESETTIEGLRNRARAAGVVVEAVTISGANRRVEYSTVDGTSVVDDRRLVEIEETMRAKASVSAVTISVGPSPVLIDFSTSTAHGNTAAKFSVPGLLSKAVPLLIEPGVRRLEMLQRALPLDPDSGA